MSNLQTMRWFDRLREDLQDIVTEKEFDHRWALIECYWAVGKRIAHDKDKLDRSGIGVKEIAMSLHKSTRTIYLACQFYEKFPDLRRLPEGKDTSWYRIVNRYLPEPRAKDTDEPNALCAHEYFCGKCKEPLTSTERKV